ncbi:MAG TPA: dienelactone hydrolase family protein [Acidimicrobiales bacterium]
MATPNSTSAYADAPKSGTGPGVLVLHSWWGLTETIKDRCNQLADAGFTVIAPDLFDGEVAVDDAHGERMLAEADANRLVLGIQSTADALHRMPATTGERIMIVGFSMGASLGLWFSERFPDQVSAVVGFYGTQGIDFQRTEAAYQLHMAEDDAMLDPDELALMEASFGLAGRPVDLHTYEGVAHHFAEEGTPNFDRPAADLAWRRTLEFLRAHAA